MAFSSTRAYVDFSDNKRVEVWNYDATGVTTGTIVTGLKKVQSAFASNASAATSPIVVLNSNNGTADTAAGSVYITVASGNKGQVRVEGY